jgi:hypothetical protein
MVQQLHHYKGILHLNMPDALTAVQNTNGMDAEGSLLLHIAPLVRKGGGNHEVQQRVQSIVKKAHDRGN